MPGDRVPVVESDSFPFFNVIPFSSVLLFVDSAIIISIVIRGTILSISLMNDIIRDIFLLSPQAIMQLSSLNSSIWIFSLNLFGIITSISSTDLC